MSWKVQNTSQFTADSIINNNSIIKLHGKKQTIKDVKI